MNNYKIIDISKKKITYRKSCVYGSIYVGKKVFYLIKNKKIEKGDPLILSEISGINAAKNISNLILLSHQICIENIFFYNIMDEENFKIHVYCLVCANAKTGVEMEAMCAVSASLLTIYDLTKKLNPFIFIEKIKLIFKDGGENGLNLGSINNIPEKLKNYFKNNLLNFKKMPVCVITMSDRAFSGYYKNLSGNIVFDFFNIRNSNIIKSIILPDKEIILKNVIKNISYNYDPNLIILTGGTGINKKDITNKVLSYLCKEKINGLNEFLRFNGSFYSSYSWLSLSFAGIYNNSIILSIPGNTNSILESLNSIEQILPHILNLTL